MAEPRCSYPNMPVEIEDYGNRCIERLLAARFEASYGSGRVGMISPDRRLVVKIPLTEMGMLANGNERSAFVRALYDGDRIPIATCRLFCPDESVGLQLLLMRYVTPVSASELDADRPYWVDFVDCQQVGLDRKGRLVAYDL